MCYCFQRSIVFIPLFFLFQPAPPSSYFSKCPPPIVRAVRHREVQFTWEYWLNGEDKKNLKTLVWGKIDGQSFLPLYETDRKGTKASRNPSYIKRISAIRVMLFSSCSFQLSNLELSDEGRYEIRLDLGKGKTQLRSSVNLSIDGKGTRNMSSCNA